MIIVAFLSFVVYFWSLSSNRISVVSSAAPQIIFNTDYISEEEKQKVELMLTFLTEESKQAAASTATMMSNC
ncbi:hypothetical protein PAMP_016817 [Pampus punctatissimus]